MVGIEVPNLSGGKSVMGKDHHITKAAMVGEINSDGQFDIVWESEGEIVGHARSDYSPESAALIADWTAPISRESCDTVTRTCNGAASVTNGRRQPTSQRGSPCRAIRFSGVIRGVPMRLIRLIPIWLIQSACALAQSFDDIAHTLTDGNCTERPRHISAILPC
jgi:hypothetical protein